MSTINDMFQGDTTPDGEYKSGVNKVLSDSMAIHGAGEDNNGSDAGFVRFSETNNDRGEMMLATGDNGNEPIVANQYLDEIPKHHIDLMDKEGNQRFNTVWSNDLNLYEEAKKIEPLIEVLRNKKYIQTIIAPASIGVPRNKENPTRIIFNLPFEAVWEFTVHAPEASEIRVSPLCEMSNDKEHWIIPNWIAGAYMNFYRTVGIAKTVYVDIDNREEKIFTGRGTYIRTDALACSVTLSAQTDITRTA